MTTLKSREITVYIKPSNIDKGDIGVRFYTEDEQTASLKFRIRNQNGTYYNFSTSDLKPVISLFAEDSSVWLEKPMELLDASKGLIEYKIPLEVIKHAGKMKAKLFLNNDTSSLHILNFEFNIVKSNVDEVVEKVVDVTSFEENVTSKIITTLKADDSIRGANGKDGIDGANGSDGKDGIDGKSAYELAVENGYTGTIEEWLESLKSTEANNSQLEMTYEKAIELGLNPQDFPKETYDEITQRHRDELNEEFTNSALYYYNPSYTIDEFMFNYVKNVEAGLADASKFNSTIGYGYLPSLMTTPQDYIDWQNQIASENGQFNGNFVEYLYKKINDLEPSKEVIDSNASSSYLKDKTVLIIGDSITEINFRTEKNYHQFIAERTGLKVINKGISGVGWQSRVGGISQEGFEQPDFICIFMGTNDWANINVNGELGDLNNPQFNTVTGAIINTYEQLVNRFPYTKILTMTPLPRIESNPRNDAKGQSGYSLGELSDRIIEVAKMYNSPVLDLYRESGLNVWNDKVNKKFFAYQDGAEDGLHPNTLGHEFISNTIQSFWENNISNGDMVLLPLENKNEIIDNGDGTFTTTATPRNITVGRAASFYMNFPVNEFDVVNNTIESLTINNVTITEKPKQLAPELIYWYVIETHEEGTLYNKYNVVKPFIDELTPVSQNKNGAINYIPTPIKIVYRKKQV